MYKRFFVVVLTVAFAFSAFAIDNQALSTYDLAPGVIPGPATPSDPQWDLQYSWDTMEAQTGDNGLLGIAFDGTYVWVTGRGYLIDPQCYLFTPATGTLVDQFASGATSSWGCRDMCFDGTYMYGGWESGLICWDITTHAIITTIPIPGGQSFQRGNAYDPATDHFYAGNFASTCYEQDRNGNVIRSFAPAPLGAVYGMAWDADDPLGPWLWIHDQTYPASGCNAHQMDPVTLLYTGFSQNVNPPGSTSPIAGGLDYAEHVVPGYSSLLSFGQGTPDAGAAWEMYDIGPPPVYDVTVVLTPENPPIQIPAAGGSFNFNIEMTNNDAVAATFQVWTIITLPAGGTMDVLGPYTLTLDPGAILERDRTQAVPERAPSGVYTYEANVGTYPTVIWDSDEFTFEKLADGDGAIVHDWANWGEAFPGENLETAAVTPVDYSLGAAYPNPFNPSATIGYYLPESNIVKLTVFDITGRDVATLVNGWVSAGSHEAVFNAHNLASGVYFYNLTVGNFTETKKMMLLK
ncbi:MAG: T9SS type A sorting domain-containing protein [candidate division Zixibacteria bacterium]|nr:T9SS type A sorting domain-containing protein [Candidatus Tariuqbacter arcticus]